jgi:hypothetical protein
MGVQGYVARLESGESINKSDHLAGIKSPEENGPGPLGGDQLPTGDYIELIESPGLDLDPLNLSIILHAEQLADIKMPAASLPLNDAT